MMSREEFYSLKNRIHYLIQKEQEEKWEKYKREDRRVLNKKVIKGFNDSIFAVLMSTGFLWACYIMLIIACLV